MKKKLTNCKLNKKTQIKLLEFFLHGVTARAATDLLEIHHKTAALFFTKVRKNIAYYLKIENLGIFDGDIYLDKANLLVLVKVKCRCSVVYKMIVFELLKRNGKVYTVLVLDTKFFA